MPTLATALHRVEGIEKAYLYGSFAKNEGDSPSDIDLLIVGYLDAISLAAEVARLEKMLHREVSYTILKPQELKRRLAAHDPFLTVVWQGKRIELVGHEQDQATTN